MRLVAGSRWQDPSPYRLCRGVPVPLPSRPDSHLVAIIRPLAVTASPCLVTAFGSGSLLVPGHGGPTPLRLRSRCASFGRAWVASRSAASLLVRSRFLHPSSRLATTSSSWLLALIRTLSAPGHGDVAPIHCVRPTAYSPHYASRYVARTEPSSPRKDVR